MNIYTLLLCPTMRKVDIVAIPICKESSVLGNSRVVTAYRRLQFLEKFKQICSLRDDYNKVINDYMQNYYLTKVLESDIIDDRYYISHHAVFRSDKTTSHVRIVIDASPKTYSGLSLNDILHTGPNL